MIADSMTDRLLLLPGWEPLRKACLEWCDPELVARMYAVCVVSEPPRPHPSWWETGTLSDEAVRRSQWHIRNWEERVDRLKERCRDANSSVEKEFCSRVAAGEIVLQGLQMKPAPAAEAIILPPAWASHLVIDFPGNSVQFGDAVFVDAKAFRRPAEGWPVEGLTQPEAMAAKPHGEKLRSGRKPFPETLMIAIVRDAGHAYGSHKFAAQCFRAEFRRRHPLLPSPAESSIRRRLPELYRRAAELSPD